MDGKNGYDFFIAHASADKAAAERFFDLLSREAEVFLDTKCLKPGDHWPNVIREAQRSSRVTVVLISDRSGQAFYEDEEIAAAITLAQKADGVHRVVPVYLSGRSPKDPPYGLSPIHALTVGEDMPVEEIAEQLLALHRLRDADIPASTTGLPCLSPSPTELVGISISESNPVKLAISPRQDQAPATSAASRLRRAAAVFDYFVRQYTAELSADQNAPGNGRTLLRARLVDLETELRILSDADLRSGPAMRFRFMVRTPRDRARDQIVELRGVLDQDRDGNVELRRLVASLVQVRDLIREWVPA